MTSLRGVVDHHWRALLAADVGGDTGFLTSALPVVSNAGPLLAAIDVDGGRHVLVPLAPRQTVREDHDGRAVHLRVRALQTADVYRRYADLVLVDDDLTEEFTTLCAEVMVAVESDPDRPLRALRRVLSRWRSLLAGSSQKLTTHALVGLFGELIVLRRLLDADGGAVAWWFGPTGAVHDFRHGLRALEVKTSLITEGTSVHIHGVDQLEPPENGELALAWLRVRRSADGRSVPDLLNEVKAVADEPDLVDARVRALGYDHVDRPHYDAVRLTLVEETNFRVDGEFPRVTRAMLRGAANDPAVSELTYAIDLAAGSARSSEVRTSTVEALLGAA
jgi:hypothetical protein